MMRSCFLTRNEHHWEVSAFSKLIQLKSAQEENRHEFFSVGVLLSSRVKESSSRIGRGLEGTLD